MTILEIYKKYQIMPGLAEHQLKVAGVAKIICTNITQAIDELDILKACLLHDMGNIIKFDLNKTQQLVPNGFGRHDLTYWLGVQKKFVKKYGPSEHQAALVIARELGVGQRVMELIDCVGFEQGPVNSSSQDFGKKICAYSDMRVAPSGVVSLEQRLADLRIRYESKHRLMGGDEQKRLGFEHSLRDIEAQIFANCKIKAENITEQAVRQMRSGLESLEIS